MCMCMIIPVVGLPNKRPLRNQNWGFSRRIAVLMGVAGEFWWKYLLQFDECAVPRVTVVVDLDECLVGVSLCWSSYEFIWFFWTTVLLILFCLFISWSSAYYKDFNSSVLSSGSVWPRSWTIFGGLSNSTTKTPFLKLRHFSFLFIFLAATEAPQLL